MEGLLTWDPEVGVRLPWYRNFTNFQVTRLSSPGVQTVAQMPDLAISGPSVCHQYFRIQTSV